MNTLSPEPDLLPDRKTPSELTRTPLPVTSRSAPGVGSTARKPRLGLIGLLACLLVIVAFVAGLVPRLRARRQLLAETTELAIPTVAVVTAAPGGGIVPSSLPGEMKPFQEASIYARASGYLKRWLVDLGDHVKAGQLLAEIDTPEIDQQLEQAKAELAQSEASLALAKTTSERWNHLLKTASVSEQEAAEKEADFALKTAVVEGARANVRRLEETKGFGKVTAPFDGVITQRNTDVGQLINTGSGGRELFRLAQTGTLRVFVRVPQALSRAVRAGQPATIAVAEFPGREFAATIVRTAGAMEPGSRTLLTELQLDNSKGELLAGGFAEVRLTDSRPEPVLTLPATTVMFRAQGLQVGVVGPDNKVELRNVKLGRDLGPTVEIASGIGPTDQVIANPWDSLNSGDAVKVAAGETHHAAK